RPPRGHAGRGRGHARQPLVQPRRLRGAPQGVQLALQPGAVGGHDVVKIGGKGVEVGHAVLSVRGFITRGTSAVRKSPARRPGRGLLSQRIARYAAPSFFSSSSRSSRRRILPTLVVGRLSRNSTSL